MQELLRMHLSNSVSDEFSVTYLATGLSQHAPQPEETEQLLIKKIPFAQAVEHVLDGTITDSISVAAILKVRLLLDKGLLDKRSEERRVGKRWFVSVDLGGGRIVKKKNIN